MPTRLLSLCLTITLITGCAGTRQIHFDSRPAGALVQLAGATCTTPCALPVGGYEAQFAQITYAGGAQKVVRIEGRPSVTTRVGYGITTATAKTLKYVSIPLLGLGLFGLILFSGSETDSFSNNNYQYDSYGFYITLGALASGGALAWMANRLEHVSSDLKPQEDVYVVLDVPEEKGGGSYKSPLRLDGSIGGIFSPANTR